MSRFCRGRNPRRDERGAAAVEFALLVPIFVVLTIGMISAGFLFQQWIGITQGAREAARYGATLDVSAITPTPGPSGWVSQVATVARDATGVSTADPGQVVCVALFYNSSWTSQGGPLTTADPCWADGRTEERVQVDVKVDADFSWVVGGATIDLGSRSVTRYEHGLN